MKITHEPLNDDEFVITVQVEEVDHKRELAKKLSQRKKDIQVKGFRPGKAPTSVVRRMYGTSVLVDVVNELQDSALDRYLFRHRHFFLGGTSPVPTEPAPDWNVDKDFTFKYRVKRRPDFDCTLSKAIEVPYYRVDSIEPEVLEAAMKMYQENYSNQSTADKASVAGDWLYGTLYYAPLNYSVGFELHVSTLPENTREAFTGLKIQDTVVLDFAELAQSDAFILRGAKDDARKTLEEKGGSVKLTIEEISRDTPVPSNDPELFEKVWGEKFRDKESGTTVEELFKRKIEERLLSHFADTSSNIFQHLLRNTLIERAQIPLSDDWLNEWVKKRPSAKEEETGVDGHHDMHIRKLKWALVIDKIAQIHSIEATEEDVIEHLQAVKKISEQKAREWVELQKDKGSINSPYGVLVISVCEKKVNAFIKEKITIVDKVVSCQALEEMRQEHLSA
ncbi:MAG: trigger factor [Bacteroidota bacterium]